tara:strand:- start:1054 stop:1722 length:669 start_codon:yes stop_codon:yes gene_type:complete
MANKIAVTGTGRSGTNFFATVLSELGKDVKHEAMGADGIASWCIVPNVKDAVYGPGGDCISNDFVVGHQVRNPLKAIGSLTTFNKSSWRYITENSHSLPRKIMHRAMVHWLDWNQRAGDMSSHTWKLEDLEKAPPEILKTLGWEVSKTQWKEANKRAKRGANTGASRSSNALFNPKVGPITQWRRFIYHNRKQPVTWEELRKIDSGLTIEIQDYSHSLGYDI